MVSVTINKNIGGKIHLQTRAERGRGIKVQNWPHILSKTTLVEIGIVVSGEKAND
jgi:hypothetical protein